MMPMRARACERWVGKRAGAEYGTVTNQKPRLSFETGACVVQPRRKRSGGNGSLWPTTAKCSAHAGEPDNHQGPARGFGYASRERVANAVAERQRITFGRGRERKYGICINIDVAAGGPIDIAGGIDRRSVHLVGHDAEIKRHLSRHGLTPDTYRARYNLPATYPMVAPGYSEARREVAKRLGLGRKPRAAEVPETAEIAPAAKPARKPRVAKQPAEG